MTMSCRKQARAGSEIGIGIVAHEIPHRIGTTLQAWKYCNGKRQISDICVLRSDLETFCAIGIWTGCIYRARIRGTIMSLITSSSRPAEVRVRLLLQSRRNDGDSDTSKAHLRRREYSTPHSHPGRRVLSGIEISGELEIPHDLI